ncbi:hypothetical protein BDV93DRAFT_289788 [Ceratobasidium sp. AG-I]|nr:hypothetical protein BDV93DRAFT_289788 [Ceratobasidium sp. AG-I]
MYLVERACAEALIARRRDALDASSVGGDTLLNVRDGGYSDGYNKQETKDAHNAWERQRGRYRDRRWEDDSEDRHRSESRRSESSGEKYRSHSRDSRRHDYDRERERERDRHGDMPRGDRNRTRGVEDVRHRSWGV